LREKIESVYSVAIYIFDTEFDTEFDSEPTVEILLSREEARALILAYGA
jgi:hypothetical protein